MQICYRSIIKDTDSHHNLISRIGTNIDLTYRFFSVVPSGFKVTTCLSGYSVVQMLSESQVTLEEKPEERCLVPQKGYRESQVFNRSQKVSQFTKRSLAMKVKVLNRRLQIKKGRLLLKEKRCLKDLVLLEMR